MVQNVQPDAFIQAKRSLEPYIMQRHDATSIRRILASHLSSHVNPNGKLYLSRPLSLVDITCNTDSAPHGVKGLQKEYLRCVRANAKAQGDYATISREHRVGRDDEDSLKSREFSNCCTDSPVHLFMELMRQRQKHERLGIIQDYLDVLSQKPAATVEYLDPQIVLQDVEALPKMPSEVLSRSGTTQGSTAADLKRLVDQLEKSVLRAKMLLKREQVLLAKVKASKSNAPDSHRSRLEAVGMTRSTLINWIEAELSRAGEDNPELMISGSPSPEKIGKQYINAELSSIHIQYARYAKARQGLIHAATGRLDAPGESQDEVDISVLNGGIGVYNSMEFTHPYLEQMISVSSKQKSTIQLKSHLTIRLSKQLRESNLGLDRLADESHLLPAYPMPLATNNRSGLDAPLSFGDEISSDEKPESSLRARAWAYATEIAGHLTKVGISEKLDQGSAALSEAQQTMRDLKSLLRVDIEAGMRKENTLGGAGSKDKSRDVWAVIDGNLSVIKRDGLE
ncbi:hypothetical protein QTJ16_003885 [Diplocarpon rosae]|uniref:Uncharacterized protein n=1 Tax=Diplocarpon rosae TaxID=946125 RepID=A0AAD9SZU7_9HELO|nr:hypothetical protein QTJ16_003885 [Diplocarpon rosae]PBP26849.1 hypothetical protein BUE80_DR002105 [Diplocarpon rosae]